MDCGGRAPRRNRFSTANQCSKAAWRSVPHRTLKASDAPQPLRDFALISPLSTLDNAPATLHIPVMPIYEFHCEKCGADNEILVRSSALQGTPCPKCGSKKLTKRLSTFASSVSGQDAGPACSGVPSSCGRCGTGVPHSH